ncbi:MAG: Gfo/Idh/MocA family oxidoreductase [Planctomycetes bacterium]|nr:Gfo/Idh/MocA family oxidoreductase [Planctomycetota bacterium]MCP4840083.1 Gfo/Idh/MocA family oxidoreductase [Planctomycetota bacterium]
MFHRAVWAAGADRLNVGLIGCGGRGTGALFNAVDASPEVQVAALADLFPDRLTRCRGYLNEIGDRVNVSDEDCYIGWDAYRELLARPDIDLVILATPPHFRPMMAAEAVRQNKHVFMEKPVAVDPTGVRLVMAAGDIADQKKLSIVAGTQRRHEACYLEAMNRIRDGEIGEIVAARCYWNQGGLWNHARRDEWSDMEWQLRNWLYFTWLSGDHITEQHVHNLDAINWALGAHPVKCTGMGGRQSRTAPEYGHCFDHFAVDYEYPGDIHTISMCRQTDGAAGRVGEVVQGTRGRAALNSGQARFESGATWEFAAENPNPYVQEHRDLHASIRGESPRLNEARRIAESTLTAIMGRMSAYSGKVISWDEALHSDLDLAPPAYAFGDLDVPAVPIPGSTAPHDTLWTPEA